MKMNGVELKDFDFIEYINNGFVIALTNYADFCDEDGFGEKVYGYGESTGFLEFTEKSRKFVDSESSECIHLVKGFDELKKIGDIQVFYSWAANNGIDVGEELEEWLNS